MQFKSVLYRIFETVWLLPYFFFGHVTQKQIIAIEMANEYLVDPVGFRCINLIVR